MFIKGDKVKCNEVKGVVTSDQNDDGYILIRRHTGDTIAAHVDFVSSDSSKLDIDYSTIQYKLDRAAALIKEATKLAGPNLLHTYNKINNVHTDEDGEFIISLRLLEEAIDTVGWSSSSMGC